MSTPTESAQMNPSAQGLGELPKTYRPADHEPRISARWDAAKAFHADPRRVLAGQAQPYAIVIPPPNVTGALHLGHGLNNTLQDILARSHRMRGYETLWMPGTDHAGIATQAVVEKRLLKEDKKRRTDFSRDEFVAKVQAFKDEYEARITTQLRTMGCSCDWDRQRFTMDPVCAAAVREAFFRLFVDGLIYRGKRLVNWDPALQTAVADDECYDEDVDTSFWYLRYPLVHASSQDPSIRTGGRDGVDPVPVTWSELASRGYPVPAGVDADAHASVTVATTRPETYLGDTAVAVNPHDPRARALRGLFVELPLVGRVIPIIEDSYVVLPKALARDGNEAADPKAEFATGFLKVTPAHDPNDYDIGLRHKLPLINMMSPAGRVSDAHGWNDVGDAHLLVGKTMAEARKMVVSEFKARGLLEDTRPYRHSVKHSDRSKAVIEPFLSDQWYVKVTDPRLARSANAALPPEQRTTHAPGTARAAAPTGAASADSTFRFTPARYARTFETWHDNIRDWCISRQLWWGHRIPVWSRDLSAQPQTVGAVVRAGIDMGTLALRLGAWADEGRIACRDFISDDQAMARTTVGAMIERRDKNAGPSPFFVCLRHDDPEIIAYLESHGFTQDPDVLDTWFSSALWPLSTLGWPDPAAAARITGDPTTADLLKAFNPTSTLSTAREIITLWVSRMVMFNRYFLGEGHGRGPIPFRNVYIHAVVQDGDGKRMSKSAGNGVDPLDIIASHGSDAMRFTLCKMSTETQDVRMPVTKDPTTGRNTSAKFDEGRNFCNKLWNAARFAMSQLPPAGSPTAPGGTLTLADRWMLARLRASITEIDAALAGFQFAAYAQSVYDLLWRDFCDWYLESIKSTLATNPAQQAVLARTLDAILRLLHPISPFVTEAIYEHVSRLSVASVSGLSLPPPRTDGLLCTAGWPKAEPSLADEKSEQEFERIRALVTFIREVRAQLNVQPKRRVTLHAPPEVAEFVRAAGGLVESLAGLDAVAPMPQAKPAGAADLRFEGQPLLLSNLADAADTGSDRPRLEKLVADLTKSIATLEGRLANPGYADRAPAAMVQQTRDQLTKAKADLAAALQALNTPG